MNWQRVNFYNGPNEGFSDYPEGPGNYAIYTSLSFVNVDEHDIRLHYIGTSQNLKARLESHEVIRIIRAFTGRYVWVKCKIIEDRKRRLDQEYKLIKKIQPEINYEPKKRRLTGNAFLCG